jgi:hypothetical protein
VHARDDDVAAFHVPDLGANRARADLFEQFLDPGAGGVDESAREHVRTPPGAVDQGRAPQAVLATRRFEPRPHTDIGTELARSDRIEDDQSRVVDASVRVDESFAEAVLEARAPLACAKVDAERRWQSLPTADVVVQEKSGTDHPGRPQVRLVGQHELQRLDDVGRQLEQHLALGQRFGDQPKLVVLEIAQAAVDQLRARRRSVRGEVVLFRQQHRQAPAGGIACYADAVDAAADDGEIVNRRWNSIHAGVAGPPF